MLPVRSLDRRREEADGVLTLWDALDSHSDLFGPHHPRTLAVAHQLAIALWQTGDVEGASFVLRQALDYIGSSFECEDPMHPAAIAAKSDLAAVLFELGNDDEAGLLELEAFESARKHLGKTHPVTCVLAWNRALNCERRGDVDSARSVLVEELVWLLAEDPARLEADQNIVRTMLAERLHWNGAREC